MYEGYSRCLLKLFPKLAIENLSPLPPRPGAGAGGRGVITVGVVSETFGNSSPGLCLQEIFTLLAASHWPLEIVFLSRHNLITVFAKTMQRLARETYFLDEGNISHSVHLIRDIIKPDILLYLALPTERTTATLSQYRLAPVQIQYGLGHPLSSGAVNSMDYSIISRQMLVSEADLRTAGELFGADGAADPLALCAAKAAACMRTRYSVTGDISFCDDILPRACIGYGHKAIYYTEQIVAFESLGFHIQDFSLLYFSSIGDILRLHEGDGAYCEEAQDLLRELSVSVSAESLGCRGDTQVHLYTCIQHGKKMHPSFDAALLGILNEDPKAVILLSDAMKDLLVRRWAGSWNISPDVIKQRVLFIPRMRHPDYLRLLSYSAVFLNPFPFGSGITSSDAISVCLPLVLLPEHISVLPFALAQVRALGPEYEDLFVVRSVEKYVHRAVQLASESHTDKGRLLRRGICGHKHQLFGAQKLNESVSEWAEFLVNVIKP